MQLLYNALPAHIQLLLRLCSCRLLGSTAYIMTPNDALILAIAAQDELFSAAARLGIEIYLFSEQAELADVA